MKKIIAIAALVLSGCSGRIEVMVNDYENSSRGCLIEDGVKIVDQSSVLPPPICLKK